MTIAPLGFTASICMASKSRRTGSEEDLIVTVQTGNDQSSVFGLKISHKLFCKWHKASLRGSHLIEALNAHVEENSVAIREDCTRISELLRRQCGKIAAKYRKAVGRKKCIVLEGSTVIDILTGECCSVIDESITLKCDGHDEELKSLYEEVKQLKFALSTECGNANIGKPIDYLSPRQARRKLSEFTKHAEAVLWFAESYGLTPISMQLATTSNHRPLQIQLDKKEQDPITSEQKSQEKEHLLQVRSAVIITQWTDLHVPELMIHKSN